MKTRTKKVNRPWSQVVFFSRDGEDMETLVEGRIDSKRGKLVVTAVTDNDGNPVKLTSREMRDAKECLYDSIMQ